MSTVELTSAQPSSEIDLDVADVVLDVANRKLKSLGAKITGSITDGSVERTIDGASTLSLTVHDPGRVLLRSGIFGGAGNPVAPLDVRIDRLFWRLVQVGKQGDDVTLTFEDREVAYLRQQTTPKKAARSKMTRAEFALSLVREVKQAGGIEFVCPELHARQKVAIEKEAQKPTKASRARNRDKGLHAATPNLFVKDAGGTVLPATASQKQNAERALDVASSLNAPAKAALALVEACMVESLLSNTTTGDKDSRGILQVRDSTAGPMGIDNMDIEACCSAFLSRGFFHNELGGGGAIAIARRHPEASAGQIAQGTQGSGYPGRYDAVQTQAQGFVDAYGGGGAYAGDTTTVTRTLPYQFRRGGTDGELEDSWACLQRLAQEVNWRCFVSAGAVYFVSEQTLITAKPRLVVTEETDGILGIDFDVDTGKDSDQVTLTCRASRWLGAPGAVVALEDCGPASGRWLIASLRRGLFDATATITLKRASRPLPEPTAETATTTVGGDESRIGAADGSFASSGNDFVDKAYSAAKAIHAKRFPYVWGGGHARCGVPDGGTGRDPGIGFDCSGSTCAVLGAGGMGYELGGRVDVSGTIGANYGVAGRGRYITVYANASHVWMIFHAGVGDLTADTHFGTGDFGKGFNGAGFNPNMHPTAGFSERHWPGC